MVCLKNRGGGGTVNNVILCISRLVLDRYFVTI